MSIRRSIVLYAAVLLSALGMESAHSDSMMLTVAGDVPQANTYEVELRGPAAVLDLLEVARLPPNVQGNVCIFRGDPPYHVHTEAVLSGSVQRGAALAPGDIVLFHATGANPTTGGNVVIAATGLPRVMQLSSPETTITDLLNLLEVKFQADDRVPVLRTEQGMVVNMNARPDDVLVHGDVIRLAMVKDVDPVVISRLFGPQSSPSAATEVAVADSVEEAVNSISHSATTSEAEAAEVLDSVLNSFSVPSRVVSDSTPVDTQAFLDQFQFPPFDTLNMPPDADSLTSKQTAASQETINPAPASSFSNDAAAAEPLISEMVRVRPPRRNRTKRESVSAIPKLEIPVTAAKTASGDEPAAASAGPSALWNGIFTFGLFGAIVLITAGWLKTRAEQKSAAVRARELMNLTISDSIAGVEQPMPIEQSVSPSDAELDRLIRNRIPMQVCQADLPLRVTLFGRPAGPQRLRIDAAHEKVSTPHFAAGSRKQNRRREQVQAASVSPEAAEAGSLDRALDSLRGRHES